MTAREEASESIPQEGLPHLHKKRTAQPPLPQDEHCFMTIHVHPEVLVQLQQSSSSQDDFLIKKNEPLAVAGSSCCSPGAARSRRCSSHSPTTDDDQTVDTISTTSSDSFADYCPRVSFAEELVTDVWTRPATEDDELSDLYYTKEETDRFRVEYRMERKLLHSFEDYKPQDPSCRGYQDYYFGILDRPRSSHDISRVVVLHQDNHTMDVVTRNDDFDTPEFWSGSLTWW